MDRLCFLMALRLLMPLLAWCTVPRSGIFSDPHFVLTFRARDIDLSGCTLSQPSK